MVVDDSYFIRKRLLEIFKQTSDIEVVGEAVNGREAVRLISKLQPDVVTMDVEMPEMNGIEAVKLIMRENPTPILMFSVSTREGARATLDALEAGAVDFLPKQLETAGANREKANELLCSRVRLIGQRAGYLKQRFIRNQSNLASQKKAQPLATSARPAVKNAYSLLVIAASTGGPVAIQKIVTGISGRLSMPVLIIQHMPAKFTTSFAERLNRDAQIEVREAKDGDLLKPSLALVAPGGFQLEIVSDRSGPKVSIRNSRENEYYHPCVDVAFNSLAQNFQGTILTVVLTGMGSDGKIGAQALKRRGASIWAQSEETCTVYGMPKAIVDSDLADRVLDLDLIAHDIALL